MLRELRRLGFELVVATPHMRPGLFDNDRPTIQAAFEQQRPTGEHPELPRVELSAEHYFDDVVYHRLLDGCGLPYPGGRAALLEFYEMDLPPSIDHLLARLRRKGLTPVIAHPERYRAIWRSPDTLERLLDTGAVALLDSAALIGKYGSRPQRSARALLERGLYGAACSDAHRPKDVSEVEKAMAWIEKRYGAEELQQLFFEGPKAILEGTAKP